MRSVLLGPL